MKRTHMSIGLYNQEWKRRTPATRVREKHLTLCGTICDKTKATFDKAQVTCRVCSRKMGGTV